MKKLIGPRTATITLCYAPVLTAYELRMHIMDIAAINAPELEEMLDNAKLWECIEHTIEDFNETPPFVSKYDISNFPNPELLLAGSMFEAMGYTALLQLRQEMQYSDGGVQSALWYKSPQFTALKNEYRDEYEQKKIRIKRAMNMNRIWGGIDNDWFFAV